MNRNIHSSLAGKDFIFIERKSNFPFWISLVAILLLAGLVGRMEINDMKLKRELQERVNVSTQVWYMTDTCATQLKNSKMIQIKLKN